MSQINEFTLTGLNPLNPGCAKTVNVKLAASQTLAAGTVLGELIGADEVQTVTLAGATSGTFTLTYGGQTATGIAYNALASDVQTALRALSSIGHDNVTVTGSAGGPYTVTFQDALGFQNVAQMTNSATSLVGTNAVQTITVDATSGNFTLTFGSQTTGNIAFNALASAVQTALTGLSSIGTSNATVSGSAGGPYTVTFVGALASAPQSLITANSGGLSGNTHTATPANQTTGVTPTVTNATQTAGTSGTLNSWKAYASGNTDGSQIAKTILRYDAAVDSSGNITLGQQTGGGDHGQTYSYAPVFICGQFSCADLTGLDDTAISKLGRLIQGTHTAGILEIS